MGILDYVKIGLAVAIIAAIGGFYVLWRSASADAATAGAKLAQAEHNVSQLQANAAEAAEAARKLAEAGKASAATLVAAQAENAAQAQRLQALLASTTPRVRACLTLPLPKEIANALPR